MKLLGGMPIALAAFFCVGCVVDQSCDDYTIQEEECDQETFDQVRCDLQQACLGQECYEPIQELCETECWEREICYEPVYYTKQKCVEKQIPVKKKRVRMVPKEYTVQRLRYVPEVYTEIVVKNEMEYYYEDDWKVRTEMVCERQCEWVPRSVWKKVAKDPCDVECETQQDE